jgi:Bacterial Ig domain
MFKLFFKVLPLLIIGQCFSVLTAAVPAGSKILFLGSAATQYKTDFQALCAADNAVNSLGLTIDSFDITNDALLNVYYSGRTLPAAKNPLLTKLDQSFNYIIFIPTEDYAKNKPSLLMAEVKLLKKYTEDKGSKILLPVIWDATDAVSNNAFFEDHSYRIANAWGIDCIPVGLAWKVVLQDSKVRAGNCPISSPTNYAKFTMITTIYRQLFGEMPDSTSYTSFTVPAAQQESIIGDVSLAWTAAQSATHYTGAFTCCFTPWSTPVDFLNRSWGSMGTSTETMTKAQLDRIVKALHGSSKSVHINGYDYVSPGGTYFPDIMNYTGAQQIVTDKDFEWVFSRWSVNDYTVGMQALHQYDPGEDVKFAMHTRHYSKSPATTVQNTNDVSTTLMDSANSVPGIAAIPNYIGLAWVWEDRPDMILIPTNDQHLTTLGNLLQAAMYYSVATGKNPAAIPGNWTQDEIYVLQQGYHIVQECGRLLSNIKPVAQDANITFFQNTYGQLKNFAGSDGDQDPLTFMVTSQPAHGSVKLIGNDYVYTPNAGFVGTDSVKFCAYDGFDQSDNEATLTITVVPQSQPLKWERGVVHGVTTTPSGTIAPTWQTVNLSNTYTDMVVIATPIYTSSQRPTVTRIKDATSGSSFMLLAQTADSGSTTQSVDVEYFVVEAGVYTDATNGIKLEAKKYSSTLTDNTTNWVGQSRSYTNTYFSPVVFGQVMSYNDPKFSYFWSRGQYYYTSAISTKIYTGKATGMDTTTRLNETIGYVVFESGGGVLPGGVQYKATLGAATMSGMGDAPPYNYSIAPLGSVTGVVLSQSAMNSYTYVDGVGTTIRVKPDGSWAALYGSSYLTNTTLKLAVDEDNILGTNTRSHVDVADRVAYLLFSASPDPRLYIPASANGDSDGNQIPDLAQFAAGGDFQGNAMNSVYSLNIAGATGGITMDFKFFQRKNLADFNMTQKVLLSLDLNNWYDVDAVGFPYTDILFNRSVIQTLQTQAAPVGDVNQWLYRMTVPNKYSKVFIKTQTQQN